MFTVAKFADVLINNMFMNEFQRFYSISFMLGFCRNILQYLVIIRVQQYNNELSLVHKAYLYNLFVKIAEVGSAACFSGQQYTIPQLCYRSAQSAITQYFQICQCAMRNAAIADTSAMHNHSKKKIKLQNKSQLFKVVCARG